MERWLLGPWRGPSVFGMWLALRQNVLVVLRYLIPQGACEVIVIRGQVPAMAPPAAHEALVRRAGDAWVRVWPRLGRFGVFGLRGGSCTDFLRRRTLRIRCEPPGRGSGVNLRGGGGAGARTAVLSCPLGLLRIFSVRETVLEWKGAPVTELLRAESALCIQSSSRSRLKISSTGSRNLVSTRLRRRPWQV